MKRIDLGRTISILANVGVIGGIVFLGLEIQQTNELMIDEARRARAASAEEAWAMLAENGELSAILIKDNNGEDLTQTETFRLTSFVMRNLTSMQLAYQELPEEDLDFVIRRGIRNFAAAPMWRRTWESQSQSFDDGFVRWMDENIVNPE